MPVALKACKDCGYDGVELALMPGYATDPSRLSVEDAKEIRKRLQDLGLALMGLMENLPALGDDSAHRKNLDRLKAAVELGNILAPSSPPPVETVLGGKPSEWGQVKEKLATRLTEWAAVGKAGKTVVAVKPHVANALHTVDGAVWLMKQVDSAYLRLAFDHSHFDLRGVKVAAAAAALVPYSVFIHVKDARGTAEKFEFQLPGDGATDYRAYAKQLAELKYPGPVVVEVSGMISGKKGYDPVVAARTCYNKLSPAFGRTAR